MADDSGKFEAWHECATRIAAEPATLQKVQILRDYLVSFGGDVHLAVKLLLADKLEKKRAYHMQEATLSGMLASGLGVDEADMNATAAEDGDMGKTVRSLLLKSSDSLRPAAASTLTLRDVDSFLADLDGTTNPAQQRALLMPVLARCTAEDAMWIVRILLKKLRLGAGHLLLQALHPRALEQFKKEHDLAVLCERHAPGGTLLLPGVSSPPANGGAGAGAGTAATGSVAALLKGARHGAGSLKAGVPVKPMLPGQMSSLAMGASKWPMGCFAEIKYDGERLQLHRVDGEFYYFARSLKPFNTKSGRIGDLPQHLKAALARVPGDCILDGEVLMYDRVSGSPAPFGTLGIHKRRGLSDANVAAYFFDVLMLDGKDVTNLPLHERRKLLEAAVVPVPNYVFLSEVVTVPHGATDALKAVWDKAVALKLEGLVCKDIDGKYSPGSRHWLKVKREYLGMEMADACDLVPLGAYFGKGKYAGHLITWLMGTFDEASKKWCTVAKMGNGFKDDELLRVEGELKPQMRRIDGRADDIPAWLNVASSLRPDYVVLDPLKCPVWEIVGSEFSESKVHTAAGISIRFPRVQRERSDKTPSEATSLAELQAIYRASKAPSSGPGPFTLAPTSTGTRSPSKPAGGAARPVRVLPFKARQKKATKPDTAIPVPTAAAGADDSATEPSDDEGGAKKEGGGGGAGAGAGGSSAAPDKTSVVDSGSDCRPPAGPHGAAAGAQARKRGFGAAAPRTAAPSGVSFKPGCLYGGKCYRRNQTHVREWWHPHRDPPRDDAYLQWIESKPACKYGEKCFRTQNLDHCVEYWHERVDGVRAAGGASDDDGAGAGRGMKRDDGDSDETEPPSDDDDDGVDASNIVTKRLRNRRAPVNYADDGDVSEASTQELTPAGKGEDADDDDDDEFNPDGDDSDAAGDGDDDADGDDGPPPAKRHRAGGGW